MSKTDWAYLRQMTEEEIEQAALSDPDAQPTTLEFWKEAVIVDPKAEKFFPLRGSIVEPIYSAQVGDGGLKTYRTKDGLYHVYFVQDKKTANGDVSTHIRYLKKASEAFLFADEDPTLRLTKEELQLIVDLAAQIGIISKQK